MDGLAITLKPWFFFLQIFGPESTKEPFSLVNRLQPSFTVQSRDFSYDSQFYVFAQNPVGTSHGVKISASLIVGMKQGEIGG